MIKVYSTQTSHDTDK